MHARVWAPMLLAALGCAELEDSTPTPTPRPEARCSVLTGVGECPEASVCSDGVCTDEPRPWCACGDELGCVAGDCVAIDASNACTSERPWGACPGGEVCVAGTCVLLGADNACSEAQSWGLCPAGAACDGGVCRPIANRPCSPDELAGLCVAGYGCAEAQCVLEDCSLAAPAGACSVDAVCRAGVCELLPCGPMHTSGACGVGTFCSAAGVCIGDGTCAADADCSAGGHCVTGDVCLPAGECIADLDCGAGEVCAVAGECIAAGACLDLRDCELGQFCGVLGHCLEPGTCEATLDCTPGDTCVSGACESTPVTCTTNEVTSTGCNEYEITCCPPGQNCCTGRERCSVEATCIHHSQCLGDGDCLAGLECQEFSCRPQEECAAGCAEGEYCSAVGGCIVEGRCASDLDCPSDAICTPLFECRVHPDAACAGCYGSVTRTTTVFPNVLLVVDRSSAMNECTAELSDWWSVVREGVADVAGRYTAEVHLGLSTFPAACAEAACSGSCAAELCDQDCPVGSGEPNIAAGVPDQPTALANAAAIDQRLAVLSPGGERAIGATLRAIAAAPADFGLAALERDNIVVLVTRGEAAADAAIVPGCAAGDADCKVDVALDALAALEPSVRTYIVALGVDTTSAALNCHAAHGGTCGDVDGCAANPEPCYQRAIDGASVASALESVLREVVPCTFAIPEPSTDGLRVYADAQDGTDLVAVEMHPSHGWDFDAPGETFTLHGEACEQVRAGEMAPVLIGCHLCE